MLCAVGLAIAIVIHVLYTLPCPAVPTQNWATDVAVPMAVLMAVLGHPVAVAHVADSGIFSIYLFTVCSV